MNDNGRLTGGTAFLIILSVVLAIVGGALAPDGSLATWLLVGAWCALFTATNAIFRKVRTKVTEAEIRADERRKLARTYTITPPDGRR